MDPLYRTDVVVVGSINQDLTLMVERHPRPGETILGRGHYTGGGGKGANQAVAAARLGASVAIIGRVGADGYGTSLRSALADTGIDVTGVEVDPERPTGLAVITLDDSAENSIVVSPGANTTVGPGQIEASRRTIGRARVVLAQLEIPIEAVVAAARASTGTFCLNPAPARPLPKELLSLTDLLIPNRSELALLTGFDEPRTLDEVADVVDRFDFDGSLVVTLGELGAMIHTGGLTTHVPAPTVDAVDTTGAGDAFCGALATALAAGDALEDGVRKAVVAGAVATTRRGAQEAMPTLDEVERLLAR